MGRRKRGDGLNAGLPKLRPLIQFVKMKHTQAFLEELQKRGLIKDAQHLTAAEKSVANKEAWKLRQQEKERPFLEHYGNPPVARRYGEANGNKQGDQRNAQNQRVFYKWAETEATREDLIQYASDEANPYARRAFVRSLLGCDTLADFLALTNQTHGQPKQTLEVQELPVLNLSVFGDEPPVEDVDAEPVREAIESGIAGALEG